jgi:hypothetical protein
MAGPLKTANGDERVRVRVRVRRKRRRRRGNRLIRWLLLLLAVLAVVLFLDASYCVFSMGRDLRATRDALERGSTQIEAGDVEGAASSFAVAQVAATHADGVSRHPAMALAGLVPGVGDDLDAVRSLTTASDFAAQAGESLTLAAQAARWDGKRVPGIDPGGTIDLSVIRGATPALDRASVLLSRADAQLANLDTAPLFGPVRDAVTAARTLIGDRERLAERAATLTRLLPPFLGADGPRRYVILMMNLSDPRGAGGYPGSFGLLRVSHGTIGLQELEPTSVLGKVPAIDPPSPAYAKRYGPFGGLTTFIASTYSPDFPTTAKVFMRMWDASGRAPVDGIIAGDQVLLSSLVGVMGTVDSPAWPDPITTANAIQVLGADTFLTPSQERSNHWQSALGTALWRALLSRPLPPIPLTTALSSSVTQRHLQVFAARSAEEQQLVKLGVGGQLVMPADPLMVSWSGLVPSRTGFYAKTSIDYQATTQGDGTTRVTEAVTLTNTATSDPTQSILYGFIGDGYPLGTYSGLASVYLPEGATHVSSNGQSDVSFGQQEFGHRVMVQILTVDPGKSATTTISYTLPTGILHRDGLTLLPQPSLSPPDTTVRFDGRVAFSAPLTTTITLHP